MKYEAIIFDYAGTLDGDGRLVVPEENIKLVQHLYHRGYRLAIISNSLRYGDGHWLRNQLQNQGILCYFEAVVSSGAWNCNKPDASIFLRTITFMGVLPERCLMLGDSMRCDIQGARRVGINGLLVTDGLSKLFDVLEDDPQHPKLDHIQQFDLLSIEVEQRHFSEKPNVGDHILICGEEYNIVGVPEFSKEDILNTSNTSKITFNVRKISKINRRIQNSISRDESCIALVYYQSESPLKYSELLQHWFYFYSSSGTKTPVRVFGLTDGTKEVAGCKIERVLHAPRGIGFDELSFSDCLRSQLFKHIRHRFVYMDLDCLILKPMDDLLVISSAPVSMCPSVVAPPKYSNLSNWCNSGLIVFGEDFENRFNKEFDLDEYARLKDDPDIAPNVKRIYGQIIWSRINAREGELLDVKWNCHSQTLEENTVILHDQRGGSLNWTYKEEIILSVNSSPKMSLDNSIVSSSKIEI